VSPGAKTTLFIAFYYETETVPPSSDDPNPRGLKGYTNLIAQSAKMQGFIVFNYQDRYEDAQKKIGEWLVEGKLKRRFHIEEGLEKCPEYLTHLFEGRNTGKM